MRTRNLAMKGRMFGSVCSLLRRKAHKDRNGAAFVGPHLSRTFPRSGERRGLARTASQDWALRRWVSWALLNIDAARHTARW